MNQNTYRTLDFEAIRRWLLSYAGSQAGRRRLQGLAPLSGAAEVRARLRLTTEAKDTLLELGRQPYHDLPDVEPLLPKTEWAGYMLDPRELREIASFSRGSTEIGQIVSRAQAAGIASLARDVPDLGSLAVAIEKAVLPSGELADDASPRLADIRRNLARLRSALQSLMESFVRDKDADRLLQEKLITTRNERYVLVLKAEQRNAIPGIIHGRSGSGASLFVEPLPAVEMNNDIVSLQDEEGEEVARILRDLTAQAGARRKDLDRALERMGELDALQAAACASKDVDGVAPEIGDGLGIHLKRARHPLLLSMVTERLGETRRSRQEAVPIDVEMTPATPILVISGPNTGGKTVALKTVGVLSLMAQCGLHIPAAAGSTLPSFRRIWADIGDEQSIAQSLSTFSGHLTAIRDMTRDLALPALVLLDEVGAGTDPTEGGALGVAVVDFFRRAGAMVLGTTHHGLMKAYAQSTPGVASASFGYDPGTFEPTYELRMGEPGRSLALEMTERLGLPRPLIDDARSRLSDKEIQLDALVRKLEADKEALLEKERSLAEQQQALEAARRQHEQAARADAAERDRRSAAFAAELTRRAEDWARQAADAVRDAVRRVENARRSVEAEGGRARTAAIGKIRTARDLALDGMKVEVRGEAGTAVVAPGDRVRVSHLGVVGEVIAVHAGNELEVAVSGKRLRAPRAAVTLVPGGRGNRPATSAVMVSLANRAGSSEVNVVGLTVDEALPRVDKMLDEAVLADRHEVRVVHGFGAGRLRKAVAELLNGHPHVATFRPGGEREGGGGVTVVELKD